jgi:hypothetical protein
MLYRVFMPRFLLGFTVLVIEKGKENISGEICLSNERNRRGLPGTVTWARDPELPLWRHAALNQLVNPSLA